MNTSESENVTATGGNGADFVFFVGKHDCFEDGSVGVSDRHASILRLPASANRSFPCRSSASDQWTQDQCNYGYGTCHCGNRGCLPLLPDSRTPGPFSAGTVSLEISSRNARVQALQQWWDYLRTGLDLILDQRGADMVDVPGGASGFLPRDFKGKKAGREVYRIDPGVVSLVAELRGHKRRAAKESGQWKTRVEESQGTHGTAHQPRSVD